MTADSRQHRRSRPAMLAAVVIARFLRASAGFARVLRTVTRWSAPTPCPDWNVRQLVNHMTRGNLNYVLLARGGGAADFLRLRDVDALGSAPVAAYVASVRECASVFAAPEVLARTLDYPLGRVAGAQALAVRTADSLVHTWDLAVAVGTPARLDDSLVTWVTEHLDEIYAGLAEGPTTESRFFARPGGPLGPDATPLDRLLHVMGRSAAQAAVRRTGG